MSGADDRADGRAFALLDLDRDGRQDLAVANANAPLLRLYRNEMPAGSLLAFRFVGANREARAAPGASNRDGVGARVEVVLAGGVLVREHRAGEGFAAQNSATLRVGIGSAAAAEEVRVRWPSGATRSLGPVPAGSLVTLFEDAAASPDGSGATVRAYASPTAPLLATAPPGEALLPRLAARAPDARLRVLTSLATWCEACRAELPEIRALREHFPPGDVALLGLPVDEDDDEAALLRWASEHRPPYDVVLDLTEAERADVSGWIERALHLDALPSSIVTDTEGHVLLTRWGAPTVSDLRPLLAERR